MPGNVLRKLALGTGVIALSWATAVQSPVHAQRTIEQASNALLNEILSTLSIQITNEELLLELSYEMQYALDAGIVDSETVDELDIEVLDEELPDEELFEEDEGQTSEVAPGTTVDTDTSQLPLDVKTQLQNRLALRLATQVKYWEVIADDWATASQLATTKFDACLSAATSDEESDVCYFNEQQQLQFFYAQQLGENFTTRLNAANQLGADVVALLNQSMTRSRLTIQESLQFMNAEELATLGLTPESLEDISKKLRSHDSPSPSTGPQNSNPSNGQNQ